MKSSRYAVFTGVFWLTAALLMFLSALGKGHWQQVLIRFYYFPIVGLLTTTAMTLIYQSSAFRRLGGRFAVVMVFLLSTLAAALTATFVNPVTFLLLGIDIVERHREVMSDGIVFFGVIYLFWSFLYFQFDGRPLLGSPSPAPLSFIDRIGVEDRGKIQTISTADVECFAASGDYVEIHTDDKSYLKRETISALEGLLDPKKFLRIHRSTIVNADKIAGIKPGGSSTFELTLKSGRTVTSSRSFRSVVLDLKSKS